MKKSFLLIIFVFLSALVFAQQQVSATHQGIANARPGDWIIRANGQRVVLTQGDINYARQRLGQTTTPSPQNRPTTSTIPSRSPASNQIDGYVLLILGIGILHIIITLIIANAKGGGWAALYFFLAPIALLFIISRREEQWEQSSRKSSSSSDWKKLEDSQSSYSGGGSNSIGQGTCGAGLGCSGGGGKCGTGLGCSGDGIGFGGRATCGAGLGCSGGGGQCGKGLGCSGR